MSATILRICPLLWMTVPPHTRRPLDRIGGAWFSARHFHAGHIAEVRGDDPDLARYLRIDERELEAGGRS
ncbi:MAG: hypothetical protein OEW52_04885 [Thermoleophilia bacterium]|nr:hypothetical protein [Thermoleophilia bacterium]MDH5280470.1 hypothetical protein [Thermoleophilia bacterium]